MAEGSGAVCIELICFIVGCGSASKLIHAAKNLGITGGTVMLGKGTAESAILDYIGLADTRKEIVFMVSEAETAHEALPQLCREFKFEKRNHGIAFTLPVCAVAGMRSCGCAINKDGEEGDFMYQSITVIVDRGRAELVIEAAKKAGSTGGTIINGRGSGIHETGRLFSMDIEPEKEIVLIISENEKTDMIVSSIREDLDIDSPGKGIIYVQNVNKAYGLLK